MANQKASSDKLGANFLEVISIKFKMFFAALLAAIFCFNSVAFASGTGDPNIDNGGGSLSSGSSDNFWYAGDDGVRVTVVDANTGEVKSISVDFTNEKTGAEDIQVHFGKNSKADYSAGSALSPSTSEYNFIIPEQPLPTIISGGSYIADIDTIRDYFTDEQVVRGISNHVGIDFDELIGGDYKLMLEPIAYVTYDGVRTALTATEAALYDLQTGGDFGAKFGPLSHKNLPLSMFLEDDDLGYDAWSGSTDSKAANSDIINTLGVGIISFKEKDEEIEVAAADYEYRVDTDVYTSVTVTGGKHTVSHT